MIKCHLGCYYQLFETSRQKSSRRRRSILISTKCKKWQCAIFRTTLPPSKLVCRIVKCTNGSMRFRTHTLVFKHVVFFFFLFLFLNSKMIWSVESYNVHPRNKSDITTGWGGNKQRVQDQNRKGKRKISRMVQKQTKGKKSESQLL